MGAKAKRLPGGDAKHRVGVVGVDTGLGESLKIPAHAYAVCIAHVDLHRPRRLICLGLLIMRAFVVPTLHLHPRVDFPQALVERIVDKGNPAHQVPDDDVADHRVLFRGLGHRRRRLCDIARNLRRLHALAEIVRALRQHLLFRRHDHSSSLLVIVGAAAHH